MKRFYAAVGFLFLVLTLPAKANPYDYKVTRVLDGDTVEFEAKFMPPPLKPLLVIRVLGVDTPEKGGRAACEKEAKMGAMATAFTKKQIAEAKKIQIELQSHDKFGGRVLGDVILDGKRLSELLIAAGLARPYFGEKKQSWCD
jgi:endonuclease YncB( thermonuclease family)